MTDLQDSVLLVWEQEAASTIRLVGFGYVPAVREAAVHANQVLVLIQALRRVRTDLAMALRSRPPRIMEDVDDRALDE